MTFLPDKNTSYKDTNYWNDRYKEEDSYEWLESYSVFKHLIHDEIPDKSLSICMLGCGNSSLSYDMYQDGFKNITNIDISPVVIKNMSKKHPEQKWIIGDMNHLDRCSLPQFDIIIEKATIDALLVDEKSPWDLSDNGKSKLHRIFTGISGLLNDNGGKFISITFSQPHFRLPYLSKEIYNWGISRHTFSSKDSFHYFFYVMTKGRKLDEEYLNSISSMTRTLNIEENDEIPSSSDEETWTDKILISDEEDSSVDK